MHINSPNVSASKLPDSRSPVPSRSREPGLPLASASAVSLSLTLLKDILEATDTLPCVKYIASVGIKIVEVVEELQSNKIAFRDLALRAQDMIIAIANACRGVDEEAFETELKRDLRQLTIAMEEVLEISGRQLTRKGYKRLLYRSEDEDNIKLLDNKLIQSFQIFQVQSTVSMRLSQRLITQRIEGLPHDGRSNSLDLVMNRPLSIPDGIYIICNAATGNVLELYNGRRTASWVPVYTVRQRDLPAETVDLSQLWSITALPDYEMRYAIRNMASGTTLDILWARAESGARLGCHPYNGGPHQLWEIFAARRSNTVDLCTIRSCGPSTVLDARCPTSAVCELLHCTPFNAQTTTQEWSLIHVPLLPSMFLPLSRAPALPASPPILSHRSFYLQNIASKSFATRTGAIGGPNVHLRTTPTSFSLWYFFYSWYFDDDYPYFGIISTGADGTRKATLDQWNSDHVCCINYSPMNDHHQWQAVPRADGTFTFRNRGSGALLAEVAGQIVFTVSGHEYENASCRWRVVYPDSLPTSDSEKPQCSVVYDSTLTFPPPSLLNLSASRSSSPVSVPLPLNPDQPKLRVKPAEKTVQSGLAKSTENLYTALSELQNEGYTSFVIIPQLIFAAKQGRCTIVKLTDERAVLNPRRYRQAGGRDVCS